MLYHWVSQMCIKLGIVSLKLHLELKMRNKSHLRNPFLTGDRTHRFTLANGIYVDMIHIMAKRRFL